MKSIFFSIPSKNLVIFTSSSDFDRCALFLHSIFFILFRVPLWKALSTQLKSIQSYEDLEKQEIIVFILFQKCVGGIQYIYFFIFGSLKVSCCFSRFAIFYVTAMSLSLFRLKICARIDFLSSLSYFSRFLCDLSVFSLNNKLSRPPSRVEGSCLDVVHSKISRVVHFTS